MQSNLPAVSDSESSTGRSSSVSTGAATPVPRTVWYKCSKCYKLFPSNRSLIQHQSESCRFAVKPRNISERLRLPLPTKPNYAPVQPLPSPRSYYYHPYLMNLTPPSPMPLARTLNSNTSAFQRVGVGMNDILGGFRHYEPATAKTRDFLSLMDPGYASRAWARSLLFPQPSAYGVRYGGAGGAAMVAGARSNGKEELDLELKI
ncbi:uncharacterized protein DS421_16g528010 [Arachis hypogaea]|nr:uncharacterized protein DS421_16g528010 [Arachis hypogaea]